MTAPDPRIGVVVLTHRRPDELARTLARLVTLPERPAVVVVDNGSRDDGRTAEVCARHPQVRLVALPDNRGAAGRNAGVAALPTRYVAFADDDTWWAPGSLRRAADLLDACPAVGCLSARVLVGPEDRPDPTCEVMAASPLPREGLPGPQLIGFMAGACVMRRQAFLDAGGYEPRFFLGAEEPLLALDLAERGWRIVFAPSLVVHHHPSPARDPAARRRLLRRNRIWLAWLRLSPRLAWHETRGALREAAAQRELLRTAFAALRGWGWVAAGRRVLPAPVEAMYRRVHGGPAPRGRGEGRRPVQRGAR